MSPIYCICYMRTDELACQAIKDTRVSVLNLMKDKFNVLVFLYLLLELKAVAGSSGPEIEALGLESLMFWNSTQVSVDSLQAVLIPSKFWVLPKQG